MDVGLTAKGLRRRTNIDRLECGLVRDRRAQVPYLNGVEIQFAFGDKTRLRL